MGRVRCRVRSRLRVGVGVRVKVGFKYSVGVLHRLGGEGCYGGKGNEKNHLAEVVRSKPGRRIYGENATYPPIWAYSRTLPQGVEFLV